MNSDLTKLQPYPFEKLKQLKLGVEPPVGLEHIALSIGEPKHPTPSFITEAVLSHLHGLSVYPLTKGMPELRQTICDWLINRFTLPEESLNAEANVLPVNGTREALFAFAQAMIDRQTDEPESPPTRNSPLVLMPNPFYQIYEGAALLAGAKPVFLSCTQASDFIPDFAAVEDATWQQCQLLYICSPGNPTGAVIPEETLQQLIKLAQQHDFVIASDECYSEIYFDEQQPPTGLLQAAANMGHSSYQHCVVFHSLSKRSNAPGLRSGFVAGDAQILAKFLQYRTYHGCAMPVHHQAASLQAWSDEAHVRKSREQYQKKFAAVISILEDCLPVEHPQAGFYLWLKTPVSDTEFARELFREQNITVLPGSYLSRDTSKGNPGTNYVRIALVAEMDGCVEAARRIKQFTEQL